MNNRPDYAPQEEFDLREVRALAAVVYPSLASTGHAVDDAIEQSLIVAEKLIARSATRERARQEVEERSRAMALSGPASLPRRSGPLYPSTP